MSMLQDFPAEVAVARVKKKPAELEGFYSEPSKLERRAAAVVGDLRKFRTELPANASAMAGRVLTVLLAVAIAVVFVASWRPAPADALSRTAMFVRSNDIVLLAEPSPLPAAHVKATRSALVGKSRPSTRVDRKAALAPIAVRRSEPLPIADAPVEIETAPRRVVELPPEPPQANIAPVRSVVFDETAAIQDVIHRYESAYEHLDAAAAKQIWPSLDERALAKAFAGLASQTISLQPCRVDVTSGSAIALCNGYATYIGRVGNKAGQIQRRTWRFQLLKSGDTWRIGSVQSN
jgi:hypothetical protein